MRRTITLLGMLLCVAAVAAPPTEPATFVQAATQAGLLEVASARVAMNASTNPDVKDFADRMITDHEKANAELAVIAKLKSLTVPTEVDGGQAKALKELREKSAQEFDAAYVAQAVRDHARALELFQANVRNKDAELAAFAAKTLPLLEEHKRMADALRAGLK